MKRARKIGIILLLCLTFIAMFPLSVRIADPIATHGFNPSIDSRVLLLWPDHIELRPISTIAEVSPRLRDAPYSFLIPKEREQWVKTQLRNYGHHAPGASWIIRIKQLPGHRQRIQLEIIGDGFWGMVYNASVYRVVPVGTRLAGPGFAFMILAVHLACWGGLWFAVFVAKALWHKHSRVTANGLCSWSTFRSQSSCI